MTPERIPRLVDGPIVREWIDRAACVGADPEIFFLPRGRNATEAHRICAGCPVRQECLDEAIENREQYGIWGGLDRDERRAYARARRRAS